MKVFKIQSMIQLLFMNNVSALLTLVDRYNLYDNIRYHHGMHKHILNFTAPSVNNIFFFSQEEEKEYIILWSVVT